jgi:hypothetical protein
VQIHISKKHGRRITLTKRERDMLTDAKSLLAELSTATRHETAEAFEHAADSIAKGLSDLDALPLVAAGGDL